MWKCITFAWYLRSQKTTVILWMQNVGKTGFFKFKKGESRGIRAEVSLRDEKGGTCLIVMIMTDSPPATTQSEWVKMKLFGISTHYSIYYLSSSKALINGIKTLLLNQIVKDLCNATGWNDLFCPCFWYLMTVSIFVSVCLSEIQSNLMILFDCNSVTQH